MLELLEYSDILLSDLPSRHTEYISVDRNAHSVAVAPGEVHSRWRSDLKPRQTNGRIGWTDGWADIRPTLVLRSVVGDDKDMSDSLRD